MPETLEVPVNDAILSFDGSVLEVFGIGRDGSARYRVELLRNIGIDGTMLQIQSGDITTMPYAFDERQRGQVERLVQAVVAARQR